MTERADGGGASQGPRSDDDEIEALFARLPDAEARSEITTRFLPFAEYLARRFSGRGESLEDLTQVAMIGLLNAIDRFDPDREVQFSTYTAARSSVELNVTSRTRAGPCGCLGGCRSSPSSDRTLPELTQQLGRSPTIRRSPSISM